MTIPAVLCVDVEPDLRAPAVPSAPHWTGFERLHDGRVSIRGPFACGPGLSPDPMSSTIIERKQEAPAG